MQNKTFMAILALAGAVAFSAMYQGVIAQEPLLSTENYYTRTVVTPISKGATGEQIVFCDSILDEATSASRAFEPRAIGQQDFNIREDGNWFNSTKGDYELHAWIVKIKNNGNVDLDMTVTANCLNATSTIPP